MTKTNEGKISRQIILYSIILLKLGTIAYLMNRTSFEWSLESFETFEIDENNYQLLENDYLKKLLSGQIKSKSEYCKKYLVKNNLFEKLTLKDIEMIRKESYGEWIKIRQKVNLTRSQIFESIRSKTSFPWFDGSSIAYQKYQLENIKNYGTFIKTGGQFLPFIEKSATLSFCSVENESELLSKIPTAAIIIPFRSVDGLETEENDPRERNLSHFLYFMIPWLILQNFAFKIYIIHQISPSKNTSPIPFNRAKNLNIGYLEAKKDLKNKNPDCLIIHDVDRINVNFDISYSCNTKTLKNPVHFTEFLGSFGGSGMIPGETVERINGFPNVYYGWGGEDQEINYRLAYARDVADNKIRNIILTERGKNITKSHQKSNDPNQNNIEYFQKRFNPFKKNPIYSKKISDNSYIHTHVTGHDSSNKINSNRVKLNKNMISRIDVDGINNCQYEVVKKVETEFYTRIFVQYSSFDDQKIDQSQEIVTKVKDLVKNHSCLQTFESLVTC